MIDDNMAVFKTDIERDVLYYRQHVKLLVAQITERCERFVEDNVTIFKPSLLMDSKQFQSEFQQAGKASMSIYICRCFADAPFPPPACVQC